MFFIRLFSFFSDSPVKLFPRSDSVSLSISFSNLSKAKTNQGGKLAYMSSMALQQSCCLRISCYDSKSQNNNRRNHGSWTMSMNSSSSQISEEKESIKEFDKVSVVPQFETVTPPSVLKFDRLQPQDQVFIPEKRLEFGQFVAREALLDEEYWTAAWLRAESHWEDRRNDRYADNYKRKFAEQEFNALKRRSKAQLGHKCTCIVAVKKEDRNGRRTVLKSVVGTLDLSIQFFPRGASFPGEQMRTPLFCSVDKQASERYGYISNLCVTKSARRQGIASNMLQFAISSAKLDGAEQVFVHVYKDNKAAQELYYKIGFQVVEEEASVSHSDKITYLLCFRP